MQIRLSAAIAMLGMLASGALGCSSGTTKSATETAGNPDRYFITTAALMNLAEIRTGRLAVEKAGDAEVRRFGQMMVDHHGKANHELADLAQQRGLTLPDRVDEAHLMDATHLSGLQGVEFDREYMGLMVA